MSTPSIVCYDFPAVVRFLDSVALAMALQQNTALEWNRYDESKVLNAMYWVMAWKTPPGTVELKTDEKRVDVVRCDLLARFVGTWLDRVCEGPRAASQYLADKARLRDLANEGIQDALREAHVINSEIGGEVRGTVEKLAAIRLSSTLAVTGVGAAAGGLAAFAVASSYSIVGAVVKDWSRAPAGQVAALKFAEEGGKKFVEESLERNGVRLRATALEHQALADKALRKVRDAEKGLAKLGLSRTRRATQNRRLANAAEQFAESRRAASGFRSAGKVLGRAATAASVVFVAMEVVDAITEYQETVAGTR
jgi:hypothetical protein